MNKAELMEAMRLGSKNPTMERAVHALGRFGLGLKSASFSQCRLLTVISCKGTEFTSATWDLDQVVKTNTWRIEPGGASSDLPVADRLPGDGTIVLRAEA